jgi:enamine deaminase RidA (YjgF/YER057c/UK114 family)
MLSNNNNNNTLFSRSVYPSDSHPLPGVWDSRSAGLAQAVVVSGLSRRIYVSGQAAMNEQGEVLFLGDKARQLECCLQNVQKVLQALGASMDHVVQCNLLVANYDAQQDLTLLLPIWAKYLKSQMASSLFGVRSLALPGMLAEVDAIAEVPL